MIITREINDRNRYVFPDLIVIAVFNSPTVPDNIPKQLVCCLMAAPTWFTYESLLSGLRSLRKFSHSGV